jgi:hypothetical protein
MGPQKSAGDTHIGKLLMAPEKMKRCTPAMGLNSKLETSPSGLPDYNTRRFWQSTMTERMVYFLWTSFH